MSQVGKKTEDEIEAQVAGYMNAPYIHMIIPTAEGRYLAEVLELPGCITDGRTPEEAYSNLEEAKSGYLSSLVTRDIPVPEAVGLKELSGNIPLRISSELHRMAALRAKQEGISLNQWIAKAIAMQVAKEDIAEQFADRVAAKLGDRLRVSASTTVNLQLGDTNPADPHPYVMPADAFADIRPMEPDYVLMFEPKSLSSPDITWLGTTMQFKNYRMTGGPKLTPPKLRGQGKERK